MSPSRSQNAQSYPSPLSWLWTAVGLIFVVFVLDFSSPSEFIVGYLYTAPILVSSARLRRRRTVQITAVAIALTLLNIWIPHSTAITLATIINRLIAATALLVTGFLSDRHR